MSDLKKLSERLEMEIFFGKRQIAEDDIPNISFESRIMAFEDALLWARRLVNNKVGDASTVRCVRCYQAVGNMATVRGKMICERCSTEA